jgi:hypothetical protein
LKKGDVTQLSATAEVGCLVLPQLQSQSPGDFKPNGIVPVCSWIGGAASQGPQRQAHRMVMRA